MSKPASRYWSKIWGINAKSVLCDLSGFDLMTGLVQDPMHVLLEGVLLHEITQILYRFIYVQSLFTLKWFNTAIHGFNYSYLHAKAKPEAIDKNHIVGTGRIKQTASAMLTLIQTLPVIIGHKVPKGDVNWVNTLRLIQIVLLCTSDLRGKMVILPIKSSKTFEISHSHWPGATSSTWLIWWRDMMGVGQPHFWTVATQWVQVKSSV